MRIQIFLPCVAFAASVCPQSCSKSTTQNNSRTGDTSIHVISPASKYVVDTYAGGTALSSISRPSQVCLDSKGLLCVSETIHNLIRRITFPK
jgi:hypothetical protein